MKAHELAAKLLENPDAKIGVDNSSGEYTPWPDRQMGDVAVHETAGGLIICTWCSRYREEHQA